MISIGQDLHVVKSYFYMIFSKLENQKFPSLDVDSREIIYNFFKLNFLPLSG